MSQEISTFDYGLVVKHPKKFPNWELSYCRLYGNRIYLMLVRGRKKFEAFCKGRPDAEKQLRVWHVEVKHANWKTPHEVKKMYRTASILGSGRVVFNICGNKYRLVVRIKYDFQTVYIRFMGTHKEYDRINAEEI